MNNQPVWKPADLAAPGMDVVLSRGRVLDPSQSIDEITEVGIIGERLAGIGESLPKTSKTKVIDCTDLIVVPGLIDLHVHVFFDRQELGVHPDTIMTRCGITTMLDAGSSGPKNRKAFVKKVIQPSVARVLSLTHICENGLDVHIPGELLDERKSNPNGARQVILREPTNVRGVKLRAGNHIIGHGEQAARLIDQAIDVARSTDTWVMMHIGNAPFPLHEIVQKLSRGDAITHCFKGGPYYNNLFDEKGRIHPMMFEKQREGVIFDVGHGAGSFDWDVAKRALDCGFYPNTISTDLHALSIDGPVYNLAVTMTKFVVLGFSLADAVAMCTVEPARVLGLSDQIGSLKSGYMADVTLLRRVEGPVDLTDSYGQAIQNDYVYQPAGVIKSGVAYACNP